MCVRTHQGSRGSTVKKNHRSKLRGHKMKGLSERTSLLRLPRRRHLQHAYHAQRAARKVANNDDARVEIRSGPQKLTVTLTISTQKAHQVEKEFALSQNGNHEKHQKKGPWQVCVFLTLTCYRTAIEVNLKPRRAQHVG